MKTVASIVFSIISVLIAYTTLAQNPVNGKGSIISGGRTRTFSFHLPMNQPQDSLSLLIAYHGDGQQGYIFQIYSGLDAVADKQNFITVYPDGLFLIDRAQFNRYVDDKPGYGAPNDPDALGYNDPDAPDDVQFTADLIDYFANTYHVNRKRVYATGHSGGGLMCYSLAVKLPTKIAAFVPVATSLWGNKAYLNAYFASDQYVKVPILQIHSVGDPVIASPIADYPTQAATVWPLSNFAARNCGSVSYHTDVVSDMIDSLTFCGTDKKLVLLMTKDASHGWSSEKVNTAQIIWNFVKNYDLATPTPDNLIMSVKSGNWNDPATWTCGCIPVHTDRILIQPGHVVTVDAVVQAKTLDSRGEIMFLNGARLKLGN